MIAVSIQNLDLYLLHWAIGMTTMLPITQLTALENIVRMVFKYGLMIPNQIGMSSAEETGQEMYVESERAKVTSHLTP